MPDSPASSSRSPVVAPVRTQCCVVGGGPAGMMLGFLLARGGIEVTVLEKHADFLRDFRGDTIHPSTLEIMSELGLLDEFLRLRHQKIYRLTLVFEGQPVHLVDFARVRARCPYVALMPQWDFLNFLVEKGRAYPNFRVRMETEADDLIVEGERIVGVRAKTPTGRLHVRAALVIGADGRHSTVRSRARLPVKDLGAPMDVMWFRLPRKSGDPDQVLGRFSTGRILVMLDRGDYWQCGLVIPKGANDAVRQRGIEAFQQQVAAAAPFVADRVATLQSWDAVKLLTVAVDRLARWHKPGVLCIGDAAHAMSPVGGVGINLAIQDAVAAARILLPALRHGAVSEKPLHAVQRRRLFPTRVTQWLQILIQRRVISGLLHDHGAPLPMPWAFKQLEKHPFLRQFPACLVGLGVRPEHARGM